MKKTAKQWSKGMVAIPYNPPATKAKKKESKRCSIVTAVRHMQIIAKWWRLHDVTPAKANQLRDRAMEKIN